MKTFCILSLLMLVAVGARAATVSKQAFIGPAISSNTKTDPYNIAIPAAGTGLKNCLTDATIFGEQTILVRFLDGGTTFYALNISSNTQNFFSFPDDRALCGSANTAFNITISTVVGTNGVTLRTFIFGYQGYIK